MTNDKHSHNNREVGLVIQANGYLLSLDGLPSAKLNDIIYDTEGNRALVASLRKTHVQALLLDKTSIRAGTEFYLDERGIIFSLGEHLFGRVIDVLGKPIDGRESLPSGEVRRLAFDVVASGINSRAELNEQFETGVSLVDTVFPIGKGQRQLLFGPTGSGKTAFIRDTIINQVKHNVVCIYVGIGKPTTFMQRFAQTIFSKGAGAYTVMVAARSESESPIMTIAPTVGFFLAEYFRETGRDVLLVLDDLGSHAKYMREVSLLMSRIPGRQSYPGDIFYQHAHLLERAGKFNDKVGGHSITVFPTLETDIENFTDLIPTNIMATTDGHLFFSPTLRAEGWYPAVALDRSVTRVGRQTQKPIQRDLSTKLMTLFVEYNKQKEYIQFGTNISARTKTVIKQGEIMLELLKQEPFKNIDSSTQISLLSLVFTPFLLNRDIGFLRNCKESIVEALKADKKLKEVRDGALNSASLNEFLEKLNRHTYILEKVCQP